MVPAMDRGWKTPGQWLRLGLVLGLAAADLGCSRLGSRRKDETPAPLGIRRTSGDVYANAHSPKEPKPAERAETKPPAMADVREVPLAMGPAGGPEAGVALQPPIAEDAPKVAPASTGVSNGGQLVASADRPAAAVDLGSIVAEARAALDRMASYQVAMHRQESVTGKLQPEEDVVLAVRRNPLAVRLSWLGGPHQGREVLYRADEPGGLMHVNMADSALPIPRLSIPPDSPMVLRNSRHPITEAGFEPLVRGLEDGLKATGADALSFAGLQTPSPLDHPHLCLVRTAPSGEVSRIFIDPRTHLPAVFSVDGPDGSMLERYVFRDLLPDPPELLATGAFDPSARWGPPRGLFKRVARGNSASPEAPDITTR